IGLTGQYAAVDERLTGFENLEHVGRLFHLGRREARQRGRELLDRFALSDAGDRVVKGYSGGMRRRLDIAMSLIARPSVLFLDEPTTGLDPRSRQSVWELIEELVAAGTTTLLTTQYLDEAERLADDIVVIDHGRVIATGTSEELKRQVGGDVLEVLFADELSARAAATELAPVAIGEILVAANESGDGVTVTVPVTRALGAGPGIIRRLDAAGIAVVDVASRTATLDDVFFALTGHGADQTTTDADQDTNPQRATKGDS
ncbi:MAG TPA: ATP-binding cassette domain-containing protein, partial [Ilumatobacteraceae bacterium]|nr:ATP-binding cassette domain-containing protein [Ilumatobacteraceae bacterium]